ncbi:disease resistance protein At4g27190-like [Quercus lobata]|uniref:disease resistance protein At4g27190-like n=1 Tax=Quercus lobata TaxID=97700 RepID=UPI0012470DFF|nr:disease resistance protein At4g27190-like [Quercus lobata]
MEVVAETVKVIVEKVVGYAIGAVARQMGYLIHFKRNVDKLRDEVVDLEDERKGVKQKVDDAEDNLEEIEAKVLTWLERVETITEEAQEFFKEEDQAKLKCLNLKARYQLGKRAHKMGLAVMEIKDKGTFQTVGHRVPIQGGTTISTKGYEDFESRKSTLNGIMRALKDDSIRAIGVYGMGGVGKTMLVGKIATQAKEDDLFEKIVKVVVSQTPDLEKIQKDIAKELGLSFQDETDSQKADLLCKRLKKEKILLIIDDIWNKIDLESRGISFGDDQKGSKLLLTSRSEDVLGEYTDPQGIFQVEALSTNEAEFLFVKIVGNISETSDSRSTVAEVVKECAGLPIAITTVANALKSRKDLGVWNDAVGQLKRANPTQIKGMVKGVYSSIKLSYDFLTKEAQSLFLFCSIFEEDVVIEIDLLWRYLAGLEFFEDVYKMEEVRNRVHTLVNSLKDSCLLLEGNESGTFKMHDVIRDVAIYIADKDKEMLTIRSSDDLKNWSYMKKLKDSFGIALFDVDFKELPERFGCPQGPQAKFIFLGNKRLFRQPIPNNVFEGMKELRVLVLRHASLPHLSSISCLHNLQSLILDDCGLEDVAFIGELKNLRALFISSSIIKRLPMEIRQLTSLQLLNLSDCSLEFVPFNVLSKLRRLEELYMNTSFYQWDVDGEITERDNPMVPKAFLFENLKSYEILIGKYEDEDEDEDEEDEDEDEDEDFNWDFNWDLDWDLDWDGYWDSDNDNYEFESSRTLKLRLDRRLQIEDGIRVLWKSCEYLDLAPCKGIKNIIYEADEEVFPQLKCLYVQNSTEIQYIVNFMEFQCVAFPVLQLLSLDNMKILEEICHDQVTKGSFLSLKKLRVSKCEKLTFVSSLTMFGCFSQLQEIVIKDCKVMRAIFSKEGTHEIQVNHNTNIIDFTQLRVLYLRNLPNLVGFHPDADSLLLFNEKVAFSNLEEIYIKGIDNLKMLWHNHQLISDSFCKIKKLHVGSCKNLINIFPPNMLRRLQNLEELKIEDCNSVEEVFEASGKNVDEIYDKGSTQLRYLFLKNLPKLKHVWASDPEEILTFQNLRQVKVSKCETLESLFPISVAKSLEQLKSLSINDCELMEEIVAFKEGLESTTKFVFPRITSLSLQLLLELKCFYPGKHTLEWPSLEILTIFECDKVKIAALNGLSFSNTDGLGSGHHVPVQQALFLIEKDTFPNLKKLYLDWNETMNQTIGQHFVEFFCKLEVLVLYGKDDKLIAGPSVFVEGLHNLEYLSVRNLFFDNEGHYAGTFERLTELNLYKMPKLVLLWKENSERGRALQNLETLRVSECGRLKSLVPSSMHFRNLNFLTISKCHGLISLATSSTVKSLVQLKRLNLSECKRMREIITNEGEGEAGDEICFNQLNYLWLDDLPSLRSFHLGNRTIKFPSLENLLVTRCPEMKIFSNGVLSMPKLKKVGLDENERWPMPRGLLPEEDVNSAIKIFWEKNYDPCVQQLFTEKARRWKRKRRQS